MYLKKKIILMLLGGIILATAISYTTDTLRQPKHSQKTLNLKRTDTDRKLDRTEAFTSNLPIIIIDTSGELDS